MSRVPSRLSLCLLLLLSMGFEWPGRLHRLRHELDRGDPPTRREAARALANYPAADVSEALLGALEDPDASVRLTAAQSAGRVGLRPAVAVLSDWLDDRDPEVRAAAARALGHIGETRSTASLVRLLGDERAQVRRAAVAALSRIGDPEAVEPLLARLDEPDVSVRVEVIEALATLGDGRAVVPLLAQAGDGAEEVQLATLGALSVLGDARALPSLLQALSSEQAPLRFAAIAAVGKLRLLGATDALVQRLSLPDTRQAKALIAALGSIGTREALQQVVEQLPNEGRQAAGIQALVDAAARENTDVPATAQPPASADADTGTKPVDAKPAAEPAKKKARRAPARDGKRSKGAPASADAVVASTSGAAAPPGTVVELLVAALSAADDPAHANAYARGLARVAEVAPITAATPPLLSALPNAGEHRDGLLAALARTQSPQALEPLLQQLTPAEGQSIGAGLDALTDYYARVPIDARSADPLLAALPHVKGAQRVTVLELLGRTGAPHAVEVVSSMASADDDAVRRAALGALGQIGGKAAQALLLSQLDHPQGSTRLAAAQGLAACGNAVAAKQLLERLLNEAPLDRHAALVALGPILGRLERSGGVHPTLAEVATNVIERVARGHNAGLSARAIDALSHWRPKKGLQLLATYLRATASSVRTRATRAVGRFPDEGDARGLIRYLFEHSSTKVASAAVAAMGEIGDRADMPHLTRVAARRHWPLQGVVAFAIYRMAQRGVLRPRGAQRALCELADSREPYVRANVAAAMATLGVGACDDGGPSPIDWLQPEHAPAVRMAAAHWLRRAAAEGEIDAKQASRALARCHRRDLDTGVARMCGSADMPPTTLESLDLYAYGADGQSLLRDRLVAVRFVDGAVLLGYTDENGHIMAPAVPAGRVLLEDPAQLPLEPR